MCAKICLVGCGWFSNHHHGPALQELVATHPGVVFAACCDVVPERAENFRERFGARQAYTQIAAMIEQERPDAILLAVPPEVTAEAAEGILRERIPLLLEKPPGRDLTQWRRLTGWATQNGTLTQVGFNRRYMPALKRAVEILDADFAPEAVTQIDYSMTRVNRLNEDFSVTAIHALDTLGFLARSPWVKARFSFSGETAKQPNRITMDALATAGTHGHLTILPGAGRVLEQIRLHAPGRTIEIVLTASATGGPQGTVHYWRDNQLVTTFTDRGLPPSHRSGIYPQLAGFHAAVSRGKGVASPALGECYQQVALMEAIRQRCTEPLSLVDEATPA